MKIVLDESVSYGLAAVLARDGHQIVAVAEGNIGKFRRRCFSPCLQNTIHPYYKGLSFH
jgi:hypothetical protein